jgi:protein involved in polysaccharide export with SLBB domain
MNANPLIWIGMLILSACATPVPPPPDAVVKTEAVRTNYLLGPGDQLRVQVFGQSDLSGTFVVSQYGTIAFPLIGEVRVTGLTTQAVTEKMADALSPDYIREPKVSVEVVSFRPFYILGEVNRPGTYPFTSDLTVMSAVATAGGFTYRANSQQVFIKHEDEAQERSYPLTSTMPVRPGDTVRIGERFF